MYLAIDEKLSSSTVTHCLAAKLVSLDQPDVVVVRCNLVEVYTVNRAGRSLRLLSRHKFDGRIQSISAIRDTRENSHDRLLLGFSGSKYSVLSYSTEVLDFFTRSLHSYGSDGNSEMRRPGKVAVDPEMKCAMLQVDGARFSLFPLFSTLHCDQHLYQNSQGDAPATTASDPSTVFPFTAIDERIKNVIDYVFMHGYYEPTVAILFEPNPTFATRLAVQRDTKQLLMATVDLRNASFTTISHQTGLPSDCWRLAALPKPVAGVLVVGAHTLIHTDQGAPGVGLALTPYTQTITKFPGLSAGPWLNVTMGQAAVIQMKHHLALISDDGRWWWCRLTQGGRFVSRIELEQIGVRCTVSAACAVGDDLVLGASLQGHLELFQFEATASGDAMIQEALESDPYYHLVEPTSTLIKGSLVKIDSIQGIGAVSDFCVGENPFRLVTCNGRDSQGSLSALYPRVPVEKKTCFCLPQAKQLFSLHPRYLVVSTDSSTMVLLQSSGNQLDELEVSQFYLEGATFYCGFAAMGRLIVQVYQSGMRLVSCDGLQLVLEQTFDDLALISAVSFVDPFLVIQRQDKLKVFKIELDIAFTPLVLEAGMPVGCHALARIGSKVVLAIVGGSLQLFDLNLATGAPFFVNWLFSRHLPALLVNSKSQNHSLDGDLALTNVALLDASDFFMVARTRHQQFIFYRWTGNAFVKMNNSCFFDTGPESPTFVPFLRFGPISTAGYFVVANLRDPAVLYVDTLGYPRLAPLILGNARWLCEFEGGASCVGLVGEDEAMVGGLPENLQMHCEWPFIRREFDKSLHLTAFHGPSQTYLVTSAERVPFALPNDDYSVISDNPEWKSPHPDVQPPSTARVSVMLISPLTWDLIDEFVLEECEHALCLQTVPLDTKQTSTGRHPFVVVGTAVVKGEDRPCRGRVLVFDVVQIVPEPGRPHTDRRLKLLTSAEMKGPVPTVAPLNGQLIVSNGAKTIIHSWEQESDSLLPVAFVDAGIYATVSASIKSYFVLGDIARSIGFHVFQSAPPTKIVSLGRDCQLDGNHVSLAADFVVYRNQLFIASADGDGHVFFFAYDPKNPASLSGTRLLGKGALCVDSQIRRLYRMPTVSANGDLVHLLLYMTIEGSVGVLTPLSLDSFKLFYPLQSKLVASLPHLAGLHPRAHRRPPHSTTLAMFKNHVDGHIMRRFMDLSMAARNELLSGDESAVFYEEMRKYFGRWI